MRVHLILVLGLVTAAAAGCTKAQARTEPEMPVLMPPPPPPRVVETYVDAPVATIEPGPAETAMASSPSRPPVKPTTPAKPESSAKPEPARTEPERPSPSPPSLTLKPTGGSENKTETSIRSLLARAAKDLGRVNYAALGVDGQAQYDQARRFMEQAEQVLRGGNLVLAGKLADKAANMAAILVR